MALLPTASPSPSADPKEAKPPPKPAVFVSFDRQNIRENDVVPVQVWFTNEWEQPFNSVNMQVSGPAFLKWYKESCQSLKSLQTDAEYKQAEIPETGLALGVVQPNSVVRKTLCIKSDSDIVIGDFNVSIAFDYSWQQGSTVPHSLVTSEKTLKAGLLGSDSIAGVPLVLAGFIVPGLFFWLILSKFPLSQYAWLKWIPTDVALGDKLVYSLIVSFFIVLVGNSFSLVNLSNSISMAKLFSYASQGIIYGLVIGGSLWALGWVWETSKTQRAAAKEKEIKASDELIVQLKKLLALHPNRQTPKTTLKLKDGRTLLGSLTEQTKDQIVLAGWFQINLETLAASEETLNKVNEYYNAGKWMEALDLAGNASLSSRQKIQELSGGKKKSASENTAMLFIEKDLVDMNSIEESDDGEDKFLELV